MPRSRIIILIAVLIALLPMLGFPRAWESFFQIVGGLSIVGLSVWTTIDRKLSMKAKAQMRRSRHAQPLSPEVAVAPLLATEADLVPTASVSSVENSFESRSSNFNEPLN